MPLYDYQCSQCRNVAEVRHGFNDTYSEPCAACGGEMKRIISPAPIIFKGSGFYITDSRKPSSSEGGGSSSSSKESAA
jgi:putative FmdB family regulatory protein